MTDATPKTLSPAVVTEDQQRRRAALVERIGTIADLTCQTPLAGDLGDGAYDLLRQAAAQISSDGLRLASLASPERPVERGQGSSRCPVCYDDKPHTHNAVEAVEMRGLEFPATVEAWTRYWGRTLDAALINELDFLFKKTRRAILSELSGRSGV